MVPTTNTTKRRLVFTFIAICVLCTLLTFRLGWIQIVNGEEYSRMAREQQTRDVPIEAKRGRIYDRNGTVLAMSAATFSIWVRPDAVRSTRHNDEALSIAQVNHTAAELARALDMDEERVHELITQNRALIRVARNVNKETADMIRAKRLRGIEIAEGVQRHYPLGAFAAHLLGSVTDDNTGLSGIELRYNRYLSGVPGRWIKNTDIRGNRLSHGIERYFRAEDGFNVILTIDEVIQHYVEKTLVTVKENTRADRVMSIVMDPRTGDILAMATYPDFDPNNPRVPLDPEQAAHVEQLPESEQLEYWNRMWRNFNVSDVYEPGSTFKIFTTAMALEENVSHLQDRFVCTGSLNVSGTTLRCWRHARPHGSQNFIEIFGNSCNPAFIQLAQRLGADRFYKYLELFGLTERTGIDFPGEGFPILQNRATVGPVGLATMSYGQGIAVTPIQLLTAAATIGNGGRLMQPRLVKALTDSNGNVVEQFDTRVIRQVVSEQTAAEMSLILEYSVSALGGGNAGVPGFRVGGKTGTANKAYGGVYLQHHVYASFIGLAPMDDPQIAILLIVDNPQGVRFASQTAAPGVRQILSDTLRYLNIQPQFTQSELEQMNSRMTTVPNVTGRNFSEAIGMLGGATLGYTVSPAHDNGEDFVVAAQYPRAGARVHVGGTVFIYKE